MTAAFIIAALVAVVLFIACWAQRQEIWRLQGDVRWHQKDAQDWYKRTARVSFKLGQIADATRNGKSGTSRKINRMANDALAAADVGGV